jgi:hypothetical protein
MLIDLEEITNRITKPISTRHQSAVQAPASVLISSRDIRLIYNTLHKPRRQTDIMRKPNVPFQCSTIDICLILCFLSCAR